jgi:PKD repeat protein
VPVPVASFSSLQTPGTLGVAFTDTSSNSPTSWSWDFGDGTALSTAQNPSHLYGTPGDYNVTLTASNASGPSVPPASNLIHVLIPVPVSSYTFVQTPGTNTVTFTDTSTNSPNGWAWDFGDGNTSTTQSPVHTFAGPAPYTVTLTASNSSGAGSLASQTVTVVAGPYASDTFNRAAASGTWGTAQTGGAWTYVGATTDFSLTGTAGAINLGSAGATRAAYLPVNAQDVDLTYQFNVSKLPTGGGSVYAYGSVRRSATADYRIKVRIFGTGAVYLSISQFSAGAEVTLGSELLIPGLTAVVGQDLKVHAQVSGLSPTTINARVWAASGTEPGTWQLTKMDSTVGLQGPGSVGVRAYTSGTTANNPIIETFDNFVASPL